MIITEEYVHSCFDEYWEEKINSTFDRKKGLAQAWSNLEKKLKRYPEARLFLEEQKKIHQAALYELCLEKKTGAIFVNAAYFLAGAEPMSKKHERLINLLKMRFDKTMKLVTGSLCVKDLIETESGRIYASAEVGSQPVNDSLQHSYSFLNNGHDDVNFLEYSTERARIEWHIFAGLWPYIKKPFEGSKNRRFYSNVSDFMLCMIEGMDSVTNDLKRKISSKIN
jgi:uncharacterized protein (UPF0332 family)